MIMAEKRYLRATSGFLLPGGRQIRFGDLVAADDEMFKDRDGLMSYFEPVTQETVEQATRAPGEIRIMTPRKSGRRSSKAQEPAAPTETPSGQEETPAPTDPAKE
jgi:hypothetical protein